MEHVPQEYLESIDEISGFPNAAVDRIVPEQEEGIDVLVEPFFEWIVEAPQLKGERPAISGVTYVEDSVPYLERKLLTLNTAHSATAYVGCAYGKATISAALEDDRVREVASNTLEETGRLLIEEYGFDPEEHREYQNKILARLRNPQISDNISWVARPHTKTRSRRALRLPGLTADGDGAYTNPFGDGHRHGAGLRLPERRRSGGAARVHTRSRRMFGSGPLRRHRRGSPTRGSRRGTLRPYPRAESVT